MVFEEAGTYTIEYTATDECGNTTNAERTVIVEEPPTYRTVLYTDGTFIINESSRDEAANVALHGQPTNVYDPFDPNGATNKKKYIFSDGSERPWDNQSSSVLSVEIGSEIHPTSTAYWFNQFTDCVTADLSNLDTSAVTSMERMFFYCQALTSLDVGNFNTSAVTDMGYMFSNCQSLTSLDLSSFDTSAVTNMRNMFNFCQSLTSLDVSSFNTSAVADMQSMFNYCKVLTNLDVSNFDTGLVETMNKMFNYCDALVSLDLSNFDTSSVTITDTMFGDCTHLETIYASANFVVTQVTSSISMFGSMSTNLVGGAGTVWHSNYTDKTRAHIDGGVSDPGYFTAKN